MTNHAKFFILLWCLTFTPMGHAQKTVYVSDVLYVPLRSGQGVEYRIINAAVKSGTKLTRLKMSDDGVWSQVVTEGGTEGWVRNQYLTEDMTAQLQLNQTITKLARLEKDNGQLNSQNKALSQQNNLLTQKNRQETQNNSAIVSELDKIKQLSAGAIELDRRYQDLLQKYELTQTQRDSLLAENENLKNDQRLSFLLYGAGILMLGMFLTVLLPTFKPKKGYSEWK